MSISITQVGIVETIHCDTASSFLDYLQLHQPQWLKPAPLLGRSPDTAWIFRGQRNADWQLIPSAMRDDVRATWFTPFENNMRSYVTRQLIEFKTYADFPGAKPIIDLEPLIVQLMLQVISERHFAAQFVRLADQVGHSIPEDKTLDDISKLSFEEMMDDLMKRKDKLDPRRYRFDPIPIEYSLAQHHGIPTRLLDFTDLSFAAAFFAAEDAIKLTKEPRDYEIVVWAIQRDAIHLSELEELRPRRGKIAFLHAQGGLFIYDTMANKNFLKEGKWRSFVNVIEDNTYHRDILPIRKIVLPAKYVNEVIWLLSKENITRAHLMPTYDNITETLKMSQLTIRNNTV